MNIQDYIESGILEEYALGVLSEAERTEVERQAATHPEIQRELTAILAAVDGYAQAHTVEPPAGLRERVLAGWQSAIHQPVQAPEPVAAAPAEPVVRQLVPEAEPSASRFNWLMAASVALLLLSAAANLVLYNRWKDAETSLVIAQTEQSRVATTMQAVNKSLASQVQVLRNDEFKAIDLSGTPAAPTAKARVLYNAATKAVFVDVRRLPAPPAGKQYQLWALDNGKPVDAGVLVAATTAGDSLQQMKDISSAQAFAMTVEPEGGSENPTLSTMTVIGKF
ncbi:anti-sigma factor [Hymenobacter persicinus]|uniref:anti-sigma factor n=1 Tax=Hymenobacter persicinus TaxID=2025506 RepID=UPI0013EDDD48|nr:anti-sigma factor [Hymenobacter persicinus]